MGEGGEGQSPVTIVLFVFCWFLCFFFDVLGNSIFQILRTVPNLCQQLCFPDTPAKLEKD